MANTKVPGCGVKLIDVNCTTSQRVCAPWTLIFIMTPDIQKYLILKVSKSLDVWYFKEGISQKN